MGRLIIRWSVFMANLCYSSGPLSVT